MHIVGSDRIEIRDGRVTPAGERHAVDIDGGVACRERPATYRFPAIEWPGDVAADACADCSAALRPPFAIAAVAYPAGPQLAEELPAYPFA